MKFPSLKTIGRVGDLALKGTLVAAAAWAGMRLLEPSPQQYPTITAMLQDQHPYEFGRGSAKRWARVFADTTDGEGYCARDEGHLLVDYEGRVVGSVNSTRQQDIDEARRELHEPTFFSEGTDLVIPENGNGDGYPFFMTCNGNEIAAEQRLDGVLGRHLPAGSTWAQENWEIGRDISLDYALLQAARSRGESAEVATRLSAIAYVESNGIRNVRSDEGARGALQIMPYNLARCGVPEAYHNHRYAQAVCAVDVFRDKRRVIEHVLQDEFPEREFSDRVILDLTTLAYNTGEGNVSMIIESDRFREMVENRWPVLGASDSDLVVNAAWAHYGIGMRAGERLGRDGARYLPRVLAAEREVRDGRTLGARTWRAITGVVN